MSSSSIRIPHKNVVVKKIFINVSDLSRQSPLRNFRSRAGVKERAEEEVDWTLLSRRTG